MVIRSKTSNVHTNEETSFKIPRPHSIYDENEREPPKIATVNWSTSIMTDQIKIGPLVDGGAPYPAMV